MTDTIIFTTMMFGATIASGLATCSPIVMYYMANRRRQHLRALDVQRAQHETRDVATVKLQQQYLLCKDILRKK